MYYESKRPWWCFLMLIAPIAVIPVGLKMYSQYSTEKQVKDEQPLDGKVAQREPDEMSDWGIVVSLAWFTILSAAMTWLFIVTSKYSVEASDLGIRFGYRSGLWSNRFSRQDMIRAYPSECKFKEFGGFGIRYSFKKKRWGYICWSGSGVHLEAMKGSKHKRYVFSCRDPEACIAALNLSAEQTELPESES